MKISSFTTTAILLSVGGLSVQTLAEEHQNTERMLPKRIYVGNLPGRRRRRLGIPWIDLLDTSDCKHGGNRRLASPWISLQGGELQDCKVYCDLAIGCDGDNIVWADGLLDIDCEARSKIYCPEDTSKKCKCEKE